MRRVQYDPELHPQLITWMCRSGLVDAQIAKELGITRKTLWMWKKRHEAVSGALKQSRVLTDHLVEGSLLKRALGYEYDEREVRFEGDGADRKVAGVKTYRKHVAASTTACIFWLKNRRPDLWRDRQDLNVSGPLPESRELRQALLADPEVERLSDELQRRVASIQSAGSSAVDAEPGGHGPEADPGAVRGPEACSPDQPDAAPGGGSV